MIKIKKGFDFLIEGVLKQEIVDVFVVMCVVILGEEYVGMCFIMYV